MGRTGVWVSAFMNSIIHKIFFEFLQPFRYIGIQRVALFCTVVFGFIWLAWSTGRPVLSSLQHVNLTQMHWMGIYPTQVFPCSWSHCHFDTVVVGEVDELEEDVGWLISCLEGVTDVEEGKLEEELVDKPDYTISSKYPFQQNSSPFCWSCASTLRSRQQILVPQV